MSEQRTCEEHLQRALAEASRLTDELRAEQEVLTQSERARKSLESQLKETRDRLDEAETSNTRGIHVTSQNAILFPVFRLYSCYFLGGKRLVQKLEQRIHELEQELDTEQKKHAETSKTLRKHDRRMKGDEC